MDRVRVSPFLYLWFYSFSSALYSQPRQGTTLGVSFSSSSFCQVVILSVSPFLVSYLNIGAHPLFPITCSIPPNRSPPSFCYLRFVRTNGLAVLFWVSCFVPPSRCFTGSVLDLCRVHHGGSASWDRVWACYGSTGRSKYGIFGDI